MLQTALLLAQVDVESVAKSPFALQRKVLVVLLPGNFPVSFIRSLRAAARTWTLFAALLRCASSMNFRTVGVKMATRIEMTARMTMISIRVNPLSVRRDAWEVRREAEWVRLEAP